jgi:hypothetical protein
MLYLYCTCAHDGARCAVNMMRLVAVTVSDVKKASSRSSMDHRPAGRAACTAQLRGQAYAQHSGVLWVRCGGGRRRGLLCVLPPLHLRAAAPFLPMKTARSLGGTVSLPQAFPRPGGPTGRGNSMDHGSLGGRGRRATAPLRPPPTPNRSPAGPWFGIRE